MGKPTGFMEYARTVPLSRHPRERVRDWNEFHEHLSGGGRCGTRVRAAWTAASPSATPAR